MKGAGESGRAVATGTAPSGLASDAVMELQGLFGPFQFPELLLQRIWGERMFDLAAARTMDGRAVVVDFAGRWNRQGGPDFRDARLRIGDAWVHGDVEIHLREEDWLAHGHRTDPNYANVVLHVVLFVPTRTMTRGAGASAIPVLPLLPLLWHDLEEYAADAAMAAMAGRPADRLAETWLTLTADEANARVRVWAERRWQGKVRYARLRIDRLGWREACHHTALEILGYAHNRIGMLETATRWPLAEWEAGRVDVAAVWAAQQARWHRQAVRPANHPRRRLASYANWVAAAKGWPEVLRGWGAEWPALALAAAGEVPVAHLRRAIGHGAWWRRVMRSIGVAVAVTRPRADNLWGDGWLPLLAAAGVVPDATGFAWWFIGWPGDQADNVVRAARLVGFAGGNGRPLAWGHVQGMLGWQGECERTARRRT